MVCKMEALGSRGGPEALGCMGETPWGVEVNRPAGWEESPLFKSFGGVREESAAVCGREAPIQQKKSCGCEGGMPWGCRATKPWGVRERNPGV